MNPNRNTETELRLDYVPSSLKVKRFDFYKLYTRFFYSFQKFHSQCRLEMVDFLGGEV